MRALFGGDPVWRTPTVGGPAYFNKTARTMTLWDSETGGTQQTDLSLNADGSSPISSVAVTGATVPPFYGPDGVVLLWAEFDGDKGGREPMRGSYETAGADDNSVATLVNDPESSTSTALAATIATTAGVKAKPASTQFSPGYGIALTRQESNYIFLTYSPDGSKIYARDTASASARTLAVSTDGGATFTRKTAPSSTRGVDYAWTTDTGALLALCGPELYRSTDDGGTWTLALTLGSDETILDGGMVQAGDGTLYAGVYSSGGTGTFYTSGAPVHTSTDDGVTWTLHSTFPSTMKGATGNSAIRHIHGMLAASDGSLWAATGDSAIESGIWKWSGTAWVRQTPLDTAGNGHRFCAVSIIERGGYLYWALDTNADDPGLLMRAPMTDLTAWEELADLPTSAYYSTALPDGTLLFGAALEVGTGGYQDSAYRVWAVDTDNRVSEALSLPAHPSGTGNRPISALRAHPTSGQVMFWAKAVVHGRDGSSVAGASYLGVPREGLRPTEVRTVTRETAGLWNKTGTTIDHTVASSTLTTVETVDIDLKGRTVLVIWSGTFAGSTLDARISVGPAMDDGIVNTIDQRAFVVGKAWQEMAMSGSALLTFALPGKHTIDLKMGATTGSVVASSVKRSLVVIELPS